MPQTMNKIRTLTSFCQRLLLFGVVLLGPAAIQAGEFPTADKVVIEKAVRALHLLRDGEVFRTFNISLGIMPVGDKQREGDFKTPEGSYTLDRRNPSSDYFLSIRVSYPNSDDVPVSYTHLTLPTTPYV